MNITNPNRSRPRPSGTIVSSIVMVTSFMKKWLEGLQQDEPHNIAHHEADSKNNTVVARKMGT
jgi:hypothetical protein